MLARQYVYYLMSNKMLNKRVNRLGVKIQQETDPRKKFKILDDVTDAAKATIRKNRFDKAFMKRVGKELGELLEQSELQGGESRH